MSPVRKALLQIHFCVLLWGFTAILGKLISLPALELVWWRMLIVVAVLAAWPPLWRELRALDPAMLARFAGIGILVALHWLTFYGAIKLANASVAATCIAVGPIFLAVGWGVGQWWLASARATTAHPPGVPVLIHDTAEKVPAKSGQEQQ